MWLRAGQLGDAVSHQRKENYWAHDQAETCVAHNSMRVSRRLLQWSPRSAWSRKGAHAAYYERTLYNAVLGTQRGTRPGQMLYMFPMGSGVSKAGIPNAPQGHHWSDDEHHFWCCQGSGIEAFARLADAIYWRHEGDSGADAARAGGDVTPHELLVLQLLPSELIWAEAGLRVRIHGDYAGSIVGGLPLRMSATFERTAQLPAAVGAKALEAKALGAKEPTSPGSARRVDVWLRLPAWANGLRVDLSGALKRAETSPPPSTTDSSSSSSSSTPTAATAAPAAGQMLPLQLPADGGSGSVALEFTPAVLWERIKDDRPHFASLHACIYGPLVLGGLTYAERALPARSVLTPVPQAARSQIASIRVLTPLTRAATMARGAMAASCHDGSPFGSFGPTGRHFLLAPHLTAWHERLRLRTSSPALRRRRAVGRATHSTPRRRAPRAHASTAACYPRVVRPLPQATS